MKKYLLIFFMGFALLALNACQAPKKSQENLAPAPVPKSTLDMQSGTETGETSSTQPTPSNTAPAAPTSNVIPVGKQVIDESTPAKNKVKPLPKPNADTISDKPNTE